MDNAKAVLDMAEAKLAVTQKALELAIAGPRQEEIAEELRTSLVYEVRVFVHDPSDALRLGMPATVYLPLDQPGLQAPTAPVPEAQR